MQTETAALNTQYPDRFACDEYLRSSSDAPEDFESAYQCACAHSAQMGGTHVGWLWEHALEIGLRAGLRRAADGAAKVFARVKEAGLEEGLAGGVRHGNQEAREAGGAHGLKEMEAIEFQRGQKEGSEEGNRLGSAGERVYGEKQSRKSAATPILVDVGIEPIPQPLLISIGTMTDVQSVFEAPRLAPLNWPEDDLISTSLQDCNTASTSSHAQDPCVLRFMVRHIRHEHDVRLPGSSRSSL
ncbi:hypothetical protein B0H11DRAFT_783045 [Mycena galericulata]|nr:hypothetical protein B0H11DRAFT_783045 [Mycena galericulata]